MPNSSERAGSSDTGYIYILLNPSLPRDWMKIGLTSRTPEERARELSVSSGVPTPFVVAYEERVSDRFEAERRLHAGLAEYRVNQGREFFCVPLKIAITLAARVARDLAVPGESPISPVPPSMFRSITIDSGSPWPSSRSWLEIEAAGTVRYRYDHRAEEHHAEWTLTEAELQEVARLWRIHNPLAFEDAYCEEVPVIDGGWVTIRLEREDAKTKEITYRSHPNPQGHGPPPEEFWTWIRATRDAVGTSRIVPPEPPTASPDEGFRSITVTTYQDRGDWHGRTLTVCDDGHVTCEYVRAGDSEELEWTLREDAIRRLREEWERCRPLRFIATDGHRPYPTVWIETSEGHGAVIRHAWSEEEDSEAEGKEPACGFFEWLDSLFELVAVDQHPPTRRLSPGVFTRIVIERDDRTADLRERIDLNALGQLRYRAERLGRPGTVVRQLNEETLRKVNEAWATHEPAEFVDRYHAHTGTVISATVEGVGFLTKTVEARNWTDAGIQEPQPHKAFLAWIDAVLEIMDIEQLRKEARRAALYPGQSP